MSRIYVPSMGSVKEGIDEKKTTRRIGGKVYHFYTSYFPEDKQLAYDMASRIRRGGMNAKVITSNGRKPHSVWINKGRY